MEILPVNFWRLQNEEHVQFHTEFNDLIGKANPQNLGIVPVYDLYLPLFNQEKEALNKVLKSAFTSELSVADTSRDSIYVGFTISIDGATYHFDPLKRKAALRIQVVLDQYRNTSRLSYNKETAAITRMISELTEKYGSELATLGMEDWLVELKNRNEAFELLMKNRYTEETAKTQLQMVQVRQDLDKAYLAIVKRLTSLIDLNGDDRYKEFVEELNKRINKYTNDVAIRQGRTNQEKQAPATEA